MAGIAELTLARNGQRIALVFPRYVDAEDAFDDLKALAPDAAKINSGSGRLAIEFESGGLLRFLSNLDQLRGFNFDQVIVHPDAWTDEAYAIAAPSVATTGGVIRIAEGATVIACTECGSTLGVEGAGWSLEHHDEGDAVSHTAVPPTEPTAA